MTKRHGTVVDSRESDEASWKRPELSPKQLRLLRTIVRDRLGISISEDKDYLLSNKVARMMDSRGFTRVDDLIESLRSESHETEIALAKFMTTNHTFFFREAKHLETLIDLILKSGIQRPRIWCAASSTGEEVYSIVLYLLENGIDDFTMLASDINLDVLKACRAATYKKDRLREVPPLFVSKYFDKSGLGAEAIYRVKPELVKRVVLKRLNLVENLRFEDNFDVIFCRNVLIYFDAATQALVLKNLYHNLADRGFLFVGHSEPLINVKLHLFSVSTSVYQKRL